MKKLFILLAFLLFGICLFSQVNYRLQSSNQTFAYLTSATSIPSILTDDARSASIPFGFTFQIESSNFTHCKLTSNGVLDLDTLLNLNEYSNSFTGSSFKPKVFAFWDDLSGAGGNVSYKTTGTAGNKIFTAEWRNMRWSYSSTVANISFQVLLFEVDKHIEFRYKLENNSTAGTLSASIGLTGASNSFVSLQSSISSTSISNTIQQNDITTFPATDQVFALYPSNCYTPSGLVSSSISSRGFNVGWNTGVASSYEYRVVLADYPLNTTVYAQGTTSSNSAMVTGLNPATRYDFYVRKICGVGDTSSWGKIQVATLCETPTTAIVDVVYTTTILEKWYQFNPTQTALYKITTAGLGNTCNTVLWMYEACSSYSVSENEPGAMIFNDDNAANGQLAEISVALQAGRNYLIRVGDRNNNCAEVAKFKITNMGQIPGCTDPSACNYNPMAQVSDGSCIYPGNPACTGPDLQLDTLVFQGSLSATSITADNCSVSERCLSGYGNRQIIRFSTKIDNIGTADYYIGDPTTAPPGQFSFTNCHGHAHYKGYAKYNMYRLDGTLVPASFKNGFCVLDLMCTSGVGKFGCGNMGITAGCADEYSSGLSCQWIDVTDVSAGDYRLAVDINWDKTPDQTGKNELRYDNNRGSVCIHFDKDGAGNVINFTRINCPSDVDCNGNLNTGITPDCEGNCNGTALKGDIDVNRIRNGNDVQEYMNRIVSIPGITATTCNDLYIDNRVSVYDAALLNRCNWDNSNPANEFDLCDFPQGIKNILQNVNVSVINHNVANHYFDIQIQPSVNSLFAYQIELSGVTISSVTNLTANAYNVPFYAEGGNKIAVLARQNVAVSTSATAMLRVYYASLNGSNICVSNAEFVNGNYELMNKSIGACITNSTVYTGIINEDLQHNVSIIPNPTNGVVDIQLNFGKQKTGFFTIQDATGRVLMHERFEQITHASKQVDLSTVASGVYWLMLETQDGRAVKKLIKQ